MLYLGYLTVYTKILFFVQLKQKERKWTSAWMSWKEYLLHYSQTWKRSVPTLYNWRSITARRAWNRDYFLFLKDSLQAEPDLKIVKQESLLSFTSTRFPNQKWRVPGGNLPILPLRGTQVKGSSPLPPTVTVFCGNLFNKHILSSTRPRHWRHKDDQKFLSSRIPQLSKNSENKLFKF